MANPVQTTPGQNRNFDLRREFTARADKTPTKVTSILNGALLDMLGAERTPRDARLGASMTVP